MHPEQLPVNCARDPEIIRILQEPEGNTPQDHLELLSVLAERTILAGRTYPPPTLGTYALLVCVQSPMLRSDRKIHPEDVLNALYILALPREAAAILLKRAHCEIRFQQLMDPETGMGRTELRRATRAERQTRKEWKHAVRHFRQRQGIRRNELRSITNDLRRHLNPGIGFSMLPTDSSAPVFNLETAVRTAAGAAAVLPGLTMGQLWWELPLPEVGMLLVQAARQSGLQGISRDEKTLRLWQRFQKLQHPEKPREKTISKRKRKLRRQAGRQYEKIRTAADLRFPEIRQTAAGPRLSTPEPAGMTGKALQPLRDAVVHIENMLKRQLPNGIV